MRERDSESLSEKKSNVVGWGVSLISKEIENYRNGDTLNINEN